MESNTNQITITIAGMTPEELAKDFLTAVAVGNLDMLHAVHALIERVYLTATHDVASAWLLAGSRDKFEKQWNAAKARRAAERVN